MFLLLSQLVIILSLAYLSPCFPMRCVTSIAFDTCVGLNISLIIAFLISILNLFISNYCIQFNLFFIYLLNPSNQANLCGGCFSCYLLALSSIYLSNYPSIYSFSSLGMPIIETGKQYIGARTQMSLARGQEPC